MVHEPQDKQAALKLYKAMHCFRNLPETQPIAKWLESELNSLDRANRHEAVDAEFKRKQGACQVIEKFLLMVAQSSDKVDKF